MLIINNMAAVCVQMVPPVSQMTVRKIESWRVRWAGHITSMGEKRNMYKMWVRKCIEESIKKVY
jgi:hypothetical protein